MASETERCDHGSEAPSSALAKLPDSQAGAGRHKCPVCAYQIGFSYLKALPPSSSAAGWESCKHGSSAPVAVLNNLPPSQAGAGRHKCVVCAFQNGLTAYDEATQKLYSDEVSETEILMEGAVRRTSVNAYERNPIARLRCIERYGTQCAVCGLSFETRYGEMGRDFIHVHHLRSVAEIGREYQVDPINDLRPVCPNCHAMLHRRSPPFTIEELRSMLRAE